MNDLRELMQNTAAFLDAIALKLSDEPHLDSRTGEMISDAEAARQVAASIRSALAKDGMTERTVAIILKLCSFINIAGMVDAEEQAALEEASAVLSALREK